MSVKNSVKAVIFVWCLCSLSVAAEEKSENTDIRINACSDVWISAEKGHEDHSMSRTHILKLAGREQMALIDLDCAQLTGRRILKGELYVHQVAVQERFPRELVVSTVSSEWVEGRSSLQYREDPVGKGATFRQSSYGAKDWAGPNSNVLDVTMGNGNSIFQSTEPMPVGGRWWKVVLSDRIMKTLVTESTSGLMVTGEWEGVPRECSIHSMESGLYPPYLKIEWEPADETEIARPAVTARSRDDGTGLIDIAVTVPENVFSYDLLIDGDPVPRWQIPLAAESGSEQKFTISGPRGNVPVALRCFAVSDHGDVSRSVRVRADLLLKKSK